MINGTTLCTHCQTRFKISDAQLTAHHGMVRCGHCLQAFDAGPNFIRDSAETPPDLTNKDESEQSVVPPAEIAPSPLEASASTIQAEVIAAQPASRNKVLTDTNWFSHLRLHRQSAQGNAGLSNRLGLAGIFVLIFILLAQSAYFFRVSLASHMPALKPTLLAYCDALNCSVPLPKNIDLMSMESSSLDADPVKANQITLNALLRNRASYPLAYPVLSLTLNDNQDRPLARRLFLPAEYLPYGESDSVGLKRNQEINIKLRLRIADLKPSGYRLELFYTSKD
jgi:predicted Zn finger-like uncharacterized protein